MANHIFMQCKAFYDPAASENGSLYVFAKDGDVAHAISCIRALESAGLWTTGELAEVRDDQREAYATQLKEIELIALPEWECHAGRFDHPKFPSSESRWMAWKDCLIEG